MYHLECEEAPPRYLDPVRRAPETGEGAKPIEKDVLSTLCPSYNVSSERQKGVNPRPKK
jgi:hypothetical protein